MTPLLVQQQDLERLDRTARRRALADRAGLDVASNDYLALATCSRLRQAAVSALGRGVAVGSGGSRLLRGNHPEHERLEDEAARFFATESALFFGSGYAANVALLGSLPQTGDLVVHDALIHASVHEGLRLGRAMPIAAAHNDADAFADAIARWRRNGGVGTPWIAVESLYSMDGDRAPLDALVTVAERHDAMLLIDEAHATGVFGEDGRGLAERLDGRPDVVTLRTCGKALGCEGALLCGPTVMRDFLVNRARGFIFSTAPSPLMAAVVGESLRILVDEPERRERLHALVGFAEQALGPCGVASTGSQILPLVIGDDAQTMRTAAALQAAGFDVRGIRPPSVPAGASRLRISLTLHLTEQDIIALAEALMQALP